MAEVDKQPGLLEIKLHEGADFILPMTWRDEFGVAVDLTDYTAKMQIRDQPHKCGALLLTLTDDYGLQLGGDGGTIIMIIGKEDNTFGNSTVYWDLDMIDPSGQLTPLLYGSIESNAEVTVND